MLKKFIPGCVILACVVLAATSCGGPKPAKETIQSNSTNTAAEQPVIDVSKAGDIDALLAKYDEIVARYAADSSENKSESVASDQEELANVSEKLANLTTDFNTDQLAKYNEITAKLGDI